MGLSGDSVGFDFASRSSRHGVASGISRTVSAKRFPEFNDAIDERFSELIASVATDDDGQNDRITRKQNSERCSPSEPQANPQSDERANDHTDATIRPSDSSPFALTLFVVSAHRRCLPRPDGTRRRALQTYSLSAGRRPK